MREILDDLITEDTDRDDLQAPSELSTTEDDLENEFEVLKSLSENPGPYKEYLEKKSIVVKMWSERPACKECKTFIENIFPKGSQFGYIIENYERGNESDKESSALKKSFLDFNKKDKKPLKRALSTSDSEEKAKKSRTQ